MTAAILVALAKIISGAHGRWIGCKPDAKPRIYFANHTSHLDALLLWALLPPDVRALTRPVAARDYWTRGRMRRHLAEQIFHAILIERLHPSPHDNPVAQILGAMGETGSVILFPEGGRSSGEVPMPFKSGLYHLARHRPDVELIPVLMENLSRILPKGEFLPIPIIGGVTFGAPMQARPEETKEEFLTRARMEVIKLGAS